MYCIYIPYMSMQLYMHTIGESGSCEHGERPRVGGTLPRNAQSEVTRSIGTGTLSIQHMIETGGYAGKALLLLLLLLLPLLLLLLTITITITITSTSTSTSTSTITITITTRTNLLSSAWLGRRTRRERAYDSCHSGGGSQHNTTSIKHTFIGFALYYVSLSLYIYIYIYIALSLSLPLCLSLSLYIYIYIMC